MPDHPEAYRIMFMSGPDTNGTRSCRVGCAPNHVDAERRAIASARCGPQPGTDAIFLEGMHGIAPLISLATFPGVTNQLVRRCPSSSCDHSCRRATRYWRRRCRSRTVECPAARGRRGRRRSAACRLRSRPGSRGVAALDEPRAIARRDRARRCRCHARRPPSSAVPRRIEPAVHQREAWKAARASSSTRPVGPRQMREVP
jgi:hypothetical protein